MSLILLNTDNSYLSFFHDTLRLFEDISSLKSLSFVVYRVSVQYGETVCSVQCAVCSVQCGVPMCSVYSTMCSGKYAMVVCSVQWAAFGVRCSVWGLCSMQYGDCAVCSVPYVVCSSDAVCSGGAVFAYPESSLGNFFQQFWAD